MTTTQPLAQEQKLLLQRLLASHCISNKEAKALFHELQVPNDSLEEAFEDINRQLSAGFGLEIATVVWRQDKQRYHAVVSRWKEDAYTHKADNNDDNEVGGVPSLFELHFSAHEKELVRLILEALIESPTRSLPRKDLINLRGKLDGAYRMDTVAQAEYVVDQLLLAEKWLQISPSGEEEANSKSRRHSATALLSSRTQVQMAPRAFLEFSGYLTSLGMAEDEFPQLIFHRG